MSDYFLNKIYDSLLSNKPVPKKPEPIVEKKETFKPLSKVYEILVREAVKHVAVYGSKDDVDPNNIPDKSAQGLESYGVVSKEVADRFKRQVGLETGQIGKLIDDIFKKANIPQRHEEAYPGIYNIFSESHFSHIIPLFQYIINNPSEGIFSIEPSQQYNAIEVGIQETENKLKLNLNNEQRQNLSSLYKSLIRFRPKIGSTAIGPGEVFLSLFSNAKIAGEKGGKSGDLVANGQKYEVKGTTDNAALLGGDGTANKALQNIPNMLGKEFLGKLQYRLKAVQKIKQKFDQEVVSDPTNEQKFQNFKIETTNIIKRGFLEGQMSGQTRTHFNLLKPLQNVTKATDLVKVDFTLAKTNGIEFYKKYSKELDKAIQALTNDVQQLKPGQDVVRKLDELLYQALNYMFKNDSQVDIDTLTKLIALINNEGSINVNTPIKTFLTNLAKTDNIQKYVSVPANITKLVGALHLYAYSQKKKYEKLLLINASSGSIVIFNSPQTIEDALEIAKHSNVYFDTNIDYTETTETSVGKSVRIGYRA